MEFSGEGLSFPRSGRHKGVPRKRIPVFDDSTPTADISGSGQSMSYEKTYLGARGLPLTPPSLPPDSTNSQDAPPPISPEVLNDHEETGNATSTCQINTLTPDFTPPPVVTSLKQEAQNPIYLSMSSREESFMTAKEAQSSDEEDGKMNLSKPTLLRAPKQRPPHPLRTNTLTDSSASGTDGSGHSTPRKRTTGRTEPRDTDSFDGPWVGRQGGNCPRRGKDAGSTTSGGVPRHIGDGTLPPSVRAHRGRDLRQRTQTTENTETCPTRQKFAADFGWLPSQAQQDASAGRPLSGVSMTSTITIEAIVIDTPPQKRRTLRHIRKSESLRSVSLPLPRPSSRAPNASNNTETQHRLSHKSARLSNQDRGSIVSDTSLTPSAASHRQKPREEVIPVVVIPVRHSSLKGSARNSRNHSLARSTKSGKRPTTAPDAGTGSFDVSQRRPRAMSESFSARPRNLRALNRNSGTTAPRIPVRKSSLSAPTSRNNSRTASLTSSIQPPREAPPPAAQVEPRKRAPRPPPITLRASGTTEDPPLATQAAEQNARASYPIGSNVRLHSPIAEPLTPFQPSIMSISPGPIEISEARAVPFFAHNNESILVVDSSQSSSRTRQPLHGQDPQRQPQVAESITPPLEVPVITVDSPLQNPRPPPKPPVSNSSARSDENCVETLRKTEDTGALGRRWGSLRRAMSLRRQSEVPSSFPTHQARNPKKGKTMDSEQQSFWRPRPFWDDVKDTDLDECTCSRRPKSVTNKQRDTNNGSFVGNSLGIPQSQTILQGPVSLIRRVSTRAQRRNARQAQMNLSHVSLASSRRSRRNRHYVIPRLGLRFPRYPVKDMREWVSRAMREREQEKLEARREQLRKKIGARVPIEDDNQPFANGARNV